MSELLKPVEKLKGAVYAVRCLGASALLGLVRRVDDALDIDFDPADRIFPTVVEAPVETEEELM